MDNESRKRKLDPAATEEERRGTEQKEKPPQTKFFTLSGKRLCDTENAYICNTVMSGVLGIYPRDGETLQQLETRVGKKLRPIAALELFGHFFGSGHASPWLINTSRPPTHIRIFGVRKTTTNAIGYSSRGDAEILACKFVSAGARSLNATVLNVQLVASRLSKFLDCTVSLLRTSSRNYLLSLRLSHRLNLKGISSRYFNSVNYSENSFPGCPMKFLKSSLGEQRLSKPGLRSAKKGSADSKGKDSNITATFFSSGVLMVAGCKTIEDGVMTFSHVVDQVKDFATEPIAGAGLDLDKTPELAVFEALGPSNISQQGRRRLGNQTHRSLSPNDKEWYRSKRFIASVLNAFPLHDEAQIKGDDWDRFLFEKFGNRD